MEENYARELLERLPTYATSELLFFSSSSELFSEAI